MTVYQILPVCVLALFASACGSPVAPQANALGLIKDEGSAPTIDQVRVRLLDNVNVVCRSQQENPQAAGDMGKVASISETSRKSDKLGDGESVMLSYMAQIEFTTRCEYSDKDQKPGDRLAVHGEAEFVHDAQGWKQLPLTVWSN